MTDKKIQGIIKYADKLVKNGLVGEGDFIAYRIDQNSYHITVGSLNGLTESGVITRTVTEGDALIGGIFGLKTDCNVVMRVSPPRVCVVAQTSRSIHAPLVDMAQIIGGSARVVKNDNAAILKCLKRYDSILISGEGAITVGRTLDEAFTSCLVLEKSAYAFIASSVIGGCFPLKSADARRMHNDYKNNYSVKNQANIATIEQE